MTKCTTDMQLFADLAGHAYIYFICMKRQCTFSLYRLDLLTAPFIARQL